MQPTKHLNPRVAIRGPVTDREISPLTLAINGETADQIKKKKNENQKILMKKTKNMYQ